MVKAGKNHKTDKKKDFSFGFGLFKYKKQQKCKNDKPKKAIFGKD